MKLKGIVAMVFVILVWGIKFVNTRALLFDFSALEIQVIRFAMAWIALRVASCFVNTGRSCWNDEWLFALMGLCGVFIYQLLASALCFVLWNVACKSLGVVRTTIGLYLTPIVGVIFAAAFLGELVTVMSAVGGCLIFGGVVISNVKCKMENGK